MKTKYLNEIFSCSFVEFFTWIQSSKMIIVAVLLVFIYNFAIDPLLANAELMGEPINILEPYIAVLNSGLILLITPLAFLVLISDFPTIDTYTVFFIYRIGRKKWLLSQIIKLFIMAFSILTIIFFGSVIPVALNGYWYNEWSNVVTKFAIIFPEKSENIGAQLLPENLYNQLSVFEAAIGSSLFIFAYFILIGLLLLAFSLIKRKSLGFVFNGVSITLGTALCSIRSDLMWATPMANSIIWLHYTKYYRNPIMPIWFSIIYFSISIASLLILCFIEMRKFDFDNITTCMY